MDLMQVLQGQLNGDLLNQISQTIGADEKQTEIATNGIFAALVGGLANNASTTNGLSSLTSALDRDHDGSVLDDLMGMVGTMMQRQVTGANNGIGMLGHILGDKQDQVAQQVSQSSGLNMSQIMKLMPILAPIVMAVIGKLRNSSSNEAGSSGGLGDLASILMGSAQSAQSGGFGDLIGTVLGGVLGGSQEPQVQNTQQNSGGLLGTIFGNIFKK
ncbi:MAG: DUF937 domain-containing protein [Saprospiraceae bacterium]